MVFTLDVPMFKSLAIFVISREAVALFSPSIWVGRRAGGGGLLLVLIIFYKGPCRHVYNKTVLFISPGLCWSNFNCIHIKHISVRTDVMCLALI